MKEIEKEKLENKYPLIELCRPLWMKALRGHLSTYDMRNQFHDEQEETIRLGGNY